MKEPMLSLDEIRSLWLKSTGIEEPCCEWDVLGFAAALESAILEKLCGEPVAWCVEWEPAPSAETWVITYANELDAINNARRLNGRITPLYTLPTEQAK